MNCAFGHYIHTECGVMSECRREDKHHHHSSPRDVEVISPGTGEECWNTHFGKGSRA